MIFPVISFDSYPDNKKTLVKHRRGFRYLVTPRYSISVFQTSKRNERKKDKAEILWASMHAEIERIGFSYQAQAKHGMVDKLAASPKIITLFVSPGSSGFRLI